MQTFVCSDIVRNINMQSLLHQTLGSLQAELNGKVNHDNTAGKIDPAEKVLSHPLFSPGDEACHGYMGACLPIRALL